MELVRKIKEDKYRIMLIFLCLLVITIYYSQYARVINTVWELPDEFGYLANAAYLSGTNWSSLTNLYYGFGYSFFLIPFFLIGTKGTLMIRGAILINAIFVAIAFLLQVDVMSRLCKRVNRYVVVLIAFVMSFYPYIQASATKVLSECLVYMLVWLNCWLLYYFLKSKNVCLGILLMLGLAFMMYAHTRSFVFVGCVILLLVACVFLKKLEWKKGLILGVSFVLFFGLGDMLKGQVIENVYTLKPSTIEAQIVEEQATEEQIVEEQITEEQIVEEQVVEVKNTLTVSGILAKLQNVIKSNPIKYITSFLCKIFYAFVATLGMFQLGVHSVVKDVMELRSEKKRIDIELAIKIMIISAALLMLAATVINSPGDNEKVAYYFYGRYYEYLVTPVVFFGLEYFFTHRITIKEWIFEGLFFGISAISSYGVYRHLETQEISIDSGRMAALSGGATLATTYCEAITIYAVLVLFVLLIELVVNKNKKFCYIVLMLLLMTFAWQNDAIIEHAVSISEETLPDNVLVEYIWENTTTDNVYFLDSADTVSPTRLQVLLGKKQVIVIEQEDLDVMKDNYFVVRSNMRDSEELEEYRRVTTGYYYDLYYKE